MMPEYLAPGVYLEETRSVHGPIASAPTSITAFVGATAKGPLNTATDIASIAQYGETFGAPSPVSPVSIAVFQFFSNGGRHAVVVRTASAGGRSRASASQVIGDAGKGTGVHALGHSPSAGVLLTPDAAALSLREHDALTKSVLAFCKQHGIFYLLDAPQSRSRRNPVDAVTSWAARSHALRDASAAVYFPRVRMADPSGRSNAILVPASGAVAGVYARTDSQHGVWQAPAGTKARLLGITDVEMAPSDAQMARLQSASVNALHPFPGLGILVWGARTFSPAAANSEWKYVPVRRLSLFIERSLYRGLAWSVFEPNEEFLWAQIRLSVSSFLNQLFRRGAFTGASTREAYFVRCGRDTMTSSDISNGRIIVAIGFAPLKPAEFIVLQLELRAVEAS
jgi:uncharacterized protein